MLVGLRHYQGDWSWRKFFEENYYLGTIIATKSLSTLTLLEEGVAAQKNSSFDQS